MTSEISVHDHHLVAYTVLAEEQKIVLYTEFKNRQPPESTEIVFEDVLAYHFQNDLFGNIIFDIEEVDLANLVGVHAAMFEAGWKFGWPRGWDKRKETIEAFVHGLDMRGFQITASYGMSGWIIAKRMVKIRKT